MFLTYEVSICISIQKLFLMLYSVVWHHNYSHFLMIHTNGRSRVLTSLEFHTRMCIAWFLSLSVFSMCVWLLVPFLHHSIHKRLLTIYHVPSILLGSKARNTNFHRGMRINSKDELSKSYRYTKHNGNISWPSDHYLNKYQLSNNKTAQTPAWNKTHKQKN